MTNFVQKGETLVVPSTGADIASGAIVTVGATAGIAAGSTVAGEDAVINMEGVYRVPKVASGAITQGAKLYVISGEAGTTVGSNVFLGYAWKAAADGAGTVDVRLAR
jgi:predicted RecA/RadA family phage recombinase